MKNGKNILIILERDSISKDTDLMKYLENELSDIGYELVFYNRIKKTQKYSNTSIFLDPTGVLSSLPRWLRRLIKACKLLRYPSRWKYFLIQRTYEESIKSRCKKFEKFVSGFGHGAHVAVLSRSAGGRVASKVADMCNLSKIICLGYPFEHPDKRIEPDRFSHLAHLQTPFLILQGVNDAYGGRDVISKYTLSNAIQISFVETDHDFKMSQSEWNDVVIQIKEFLSTK